jgi:polar amino acid transport system substrate-binding protein
MSAAMRADGGWPSTQGGGDMRKAGPLFVVLSLVVLVVIMVGGLVGCGTTTTTTAAATTTKAPVTTAPPTTAPPATTVTTAGTTTTKAAALKTVEAGKLISGSDTSFPPMESMNGTVAEGFDVDLVAAIAKKMGLESVFKTEIFDTLIPTLKAGGKFDIIASSMTITDERKKEISFSTPYIDSNQSIAVMKSAGIKTQADLKGKKIGVQSGTTGQAWATENLKDSTMVPFDSATKAFSALQAGNVAAVVNDLPVSAYIVKNDPSKAMLLIEEIPTGEQYGFGVSKANPDLLAAINKAIADLKADGTYKTIYDKWFATGS